MFHKSSSCEIYLKGPGEVEFGFHYSILGGPPVGALSQIAPLPARDAGETIVRYDLISLIPKLWVLNMTHIEAQESFL
jgi:hypothetical protein